MKKVSHRLLTSDEEVSLAQKIEKGDNLARDTMITHNIRLALSIANQYRKSGLNMEDISQEASIGLIKAVDRFDWRKGFRFSTYAVWWIKQSIRRFISSQGSHVKFPAGSRHTIYQISKLRNEYFEEFGVYPEDKEVGEILGLKADLVGNLRRGMQWPINIDAPLGGEAGSRTFAEIIPDESISIEDIADRNMMIELIKKGFKSLTKQEEKVLRLRFGVEEDIANNTSFPITENELSQLKLS
jgi:RNA polymerase primary sigma factor